MSMAFVEAFAQVSDSLYQKALQLQNREQYGKAIAYHLEALSSASSELTEISKLSILKNIAFCYHELSDIPHEIETQKQVLDMVKIVSPVETERTIQQLSDLYFKLKDFEHAIATNMEFLQLSERNKNYAGITQAYNNLGYLYHLTGKPNLSIEYFNKSYNTLSQPNLRINADDKAKILTNIGVASMNAGSLSAAEKFLTEAYDIRAAQGDSVKIAQSLNYLATYDYINRDTKNALIKVNRSINNLLRSTSSESRDITLSDSYKLMSEMMLAKNDIVGFRKYISLYNALQQELFSREKRRNNLLQQYQLETEQVKYQITELRLQQEKNQLMLNQAILEQQRNEKELQLKTNELAILRNEAELREERLRNADLAKKQIQQQLELIRHQATAADQQQQLALQKVMLDKKKQELSFFENAQRQHEKNRIYNIAIISLLVIMLGIATQLYFLRNRKNKLLTLQNRVIKKMNGEMSAQNEELILMNAKLNRQKLDLNEQNEKLVEAQQVISEQNLRLFSYSKDLEEKVSERTVEIRNNNARLLEYAERMEKFAYAISHNLRAPVARMLGLINILPHTSDQEKEFALRKVYQSAIQVDDIIRDLSMILELRSREVAFESIDLRSCLEKSLAILEHEIKLANAIIHYDFKEVSVVYGVAAFMDSIFYNLISNAVKYRSPDRPCRIDIASRLERGSVVQLSFKDNGIGIDLVSHSDKMFGLYKKFNLEVEGKGLGLYLVKSHAEMMDGQIQVESKPGVGSIFKVVLKHQQTLPHNLIIANHKQVLLKRD
jgi:signal transduction histidine kinase/tetratricopeptide (TPR) repeat protein